MATVNKALQNRLIKEGGVTEETLDAAKDASKEQGSTLFDFLVKESYIESKNLALRIPIIGDIVYDGVVARFGRTLSTTFAAGVPLVEALESVASAAGNVIYKRGILRIRDEVTGGIPLNVAMRNSNLPPPLALQMTTIGEESGALDDLLERVANHYEDAVDNSVDQLTSLLEPLIMCVLAILVGGLLIAMYLPIFQIGQVV